MSGRLQDVVAIVTGGGSGIGAATARRFAAEGARTVVADVDAAAGERVAEELRAAGHEARAIPTDVASEEQAAEMVARTIEAYGAPSVLVNNAGVLVFSEPLELSTEEWRRCFAVDLDGVWHCSKAALPPMLAAGRGAIVNIASIHSFQTMPGCFPYPVAKHGVIGMTRALALEYAARGVRCNAVCPGYVATPAVVDWWNAFPDPAAERRRSERIHPLGRVGEPDDVANAALFLASDEASFVTGASLLVDGGRSALYHD